ncbi:hypothetical protein LJC49_00510 [Ruminococcaceae bacterium OttesenSCG-928-I18]|nr:hypothetical protein [Ruminococcaceae bacterium OttesenSCG-928-I18]
MHYLDAGISLLALLGLCVFYAQPGRLGAALAPLGAVCTAVLFLMVGGVLGLLLPAAFLFTALCFTLCLFTLARTGPKKALRALRSPGFIFFVGMSALALVWFAVKAPVFSHWDEFSFWGTAVKLMKLSGGLYTTAETGWFWTSTEMPALPLLSWFMQFMGAAFAPWKVYLAYAVLFFAVASALTAPFGKRPVVALGLGLTGVLLPFFFLSPQRITALSPAYLSAYGDLPAGLLFGGALAFYFALRAGGQNGAFALLPLAALALVKDNTFPIALVAAALMAADTLFFCPAGGGVQAKVRKGLLLAGYFAAPLTVYTLWKQHAAFANAHNTVMAGEATGASPFGAAAESAAQLVGVRPRSEDFTRTLSEMWAAFTDGAFSPVSMVGSGLFTALLVLLLFALAILSGKDRGARLRAGLAAGLSTAGFLGFQFVLLTYFAFLNKYEGGLPDYERYSVSYFAGWLVLALLLLGLCARESAPARRSAVQGPPAGQASEATEQKGGRTGRELAAQGLVLLAAVGCTVLFALRVLPGYSVLDYPDRLYDPLRREEAKAGELAALVPEGERTYYIGQGDDGFGWFRTHYYFLPRILDYSGGGGSIRSEAAGEPGEQVLSPRELREYLRENGCTYIYVGAVDDDFVEEYGTLFTDGLHAFEGEPVLYERTDDGDYAPLSP